MNIENLKKFYKKNLFQPSSMAIIFNPFYIIRRNIFKALTEIRGELKGDIVDFGCGSKPYKNLFQASSYTGVDIKESGHDHAFENIDIFYDGKHIPLKSESYDLVFSSEVFEHIFNIDQILDELNRILKSSGKLIVTVPFVWDEHESPYDFGRYTTYGLKYLLEQKGFTVIKQIKCSHFIEVIFQLLSLYIFYFFSKRNRMLRLLAQIIFIFPTTLCGIFIAKVLPNFDTLYLNQVVIAKKTDHAK